jgi:integrase
VYAGIDPDTRRRRYRTSTVRGNRADAERVLADVVAGVRAEQSVGSRSTMSELLEAWFAVGSMSWAPTTVRQTRSVLDRYLHPLLGAIRVGDVSVSTVDTLYVSLAANGGAKGQPLSSGTIARVHVVLRSALAHAVRWGWIWDNPAQRAHRHVVRSTRVQPPSPEELVGLLGHLEHSDPGLHCFVAVAASTGARRAQLLGLAWERVDLPRGRVAFCAGWVEGVDGPVLTETKTRSRHQVELDPWTTGVLASYAARVGERDARVPTGFVFTDDPGGQTAWKPNRVTKSFSRARRAAGLRHFRLHDLRHFMATEMLQAGVPLAVVSQRLDHRRKSTTLDFYAHAVPSGDATAAITLHGVLASAGIRGAARHAG